MPEELFKPEVNSSKKEWHKPVLSILSGEYTESGGTAASEGSSSTKAGS
ncbi:MAG: hypothetical protein HQK58_18065 [Deltaproteobacteria bacterium]|nr:hypothetical protein [Deltaproteobacteria bacterium]